MFSTSTAIVFGGDNNVALPMGVTLYSLLRHIASYTNTICLYLLDGGISQENRARMDAITACSGRNVSVQWVPVNMQALEGLYVSRYLRLATYIRLLLPDILPHNVSRVLYIDTDVLVCGDVSPLFCVSVSSPCSWLTTRREELSVCRSTKEATDKKGVSRNVSKRFW